jgi:hypothetical protein
MKGSIGDILSTPARKKFQIDISFAQRSMELLPSPYKTDCIQYNVDNTFASDLSCNETCFVELEIESYGCLYSSYSKASTFFSLPFDFCTKNITKDITEQIYENCKAKCKPNCNLSTYQFFAKIIEKSNLKEYENKFIMNIFSHEEPYLSYIYTPVMDVDQLVYNVGGILTLWFGLSAYSIILRMISMLKNLNKKNSKILLSWCGKILSQRIST